MTLYLTVVLQQCWEKKNQKKTNQEEVGDRHHHAQQRFYQQQLPHRRDTPATAHDFEALKW